jgi:hypothetical protein
MSKDHAETLKTIRNRYAKARNSNPSEAEKTRIKREVDALNAGIDALEVEPEFDGEKYGYCYECNAPMNKKKECSTKMCRGF